MVDGRSFFIGLDSGVVVASADVNVGRHVYDMSRTRRQSGKSIGSSQCSLGRTRTLNGVNVIVDSAHVIGVAFDHGFECGNDLFRARLGRAIGMPQAPGVKIHARFGEESSGVEVIREFLCNFAHGIVISLGSLSAVGVSAGKAQRHSLDVGLFDG